MDSNLPGKSAPPKGELYVAMRALDAQTCEMQRKFVFDEYRGRGIGRASLVAARGKVVVDELGPAIASPLFEAGGGLTRP